jgi:hypothetical protein
MAKHWPLGILLAAFAYQDCSLVGFRNIYTDGGHINVYYLRFLLVPHMKPDKNSKKACQKRRAGDEKSLEAARFMGTAKRELDLSVATHLWGTISS